MLKKIIKRVARQPLSCIAVCLFAAVLSFSLCFLHHSLEKERVSFEETCNSIPVRYKITELDGSKFEGEGGIEKWALNQFLLKKGDFYSSTGPEIRSLYVEDDVVKISTSGAKRISLMSDRRLTVSKNAGDKLLYGAELSLKTILENHASTKDFMDCYFRIEVIDKHGNRALTRAYYLDELGL